MKMVVIGFTGTRKGMTTNQQIEVRRLLAYELGHIREAHHGDCVGADSDFHNICKGLGIRVILHPPSDPTHRAFRMDAHKVLSAKPYLERNHDIIDASKILIATPKEYHEVRRSGTWATIRYAREKGIRIITVFPSGRVKDIDW